MSIFDTIKMTWMIMWRLGIVVFIWFPDFGFFGVVISAVVLAVVLRYAAKITIKTFPIVRIITRNSFYTHDSKPSSTSNLHAPSRSTNKISVEQPYLNPENIINKASAPGRITGYEPRVMDNLNVPQTPYMRGVPGVGLEAASHMSNYNVKTGKKGEVNFSKALSKVVLPLNKASHNTIIDNVNSFWSIAMPSENDPSRPDSKYKTDIDAVIVTGENIILVDTKFYASGDVTYTSHGDQLICVDNTTGKFVNKPRKMSKNMSMAKERFKKHYPDMEVSAMVVFMPTDSGTAKVNAVWPGNIPAVTIHQAISALIPVASDTGISVNNRTVLTNLSMLRKR